jgi:hypothetical protein
MVKKIIILGVLISILFVLVIIKSQTTIPATKQNNESSNYTTVEYKITKIVEDQYYGLSEDGTKIVFSADNVDMDDNIQVNDQVVCYFEKDNIGKGLIKVEKK